VISEEEDENNSRVRVKIMEEPTVIHLEREDNRRTDDVYNK